ncbi:MAG: phosphoesterase [Deltaproteobacteria bacterium]|nr:MAG: phosphoesterase [Deltaproteobacteria bacterium]
MSIDLHIHSTCSDGTMTPVELVQLAGRSGLTAISITDHDTMAGVPEAVAAGSKCGVEVISGIEISALFDGKSIHILGYFQNPDDPQLNEKLAKIQSGRAGRNLKIIKKLQESGIDITDEEVAELAGSGQTGRPHVGMVLVKKKVVKDLPQAFDQYLACGRPAYVQRFIYPAEEAVAHLGAAGGLAVLAHPVQIDRSLKSIPSLLERLIPYGLQGIETYYPTHTARMKKQLKEYAREYNLVLTGGSDFHGDMRPGTGLAVSKKMRVPAQLLDKMKEKLALGEKCTPY